MVQFKGVPLLRNDGPLRIVLVKWNGASGSQLPLLELGIQAQHGQATIAAGAFGEIADRQIVLAKELDRSSGRGRQFCFFAQGNLPEES